MSHRAEHRFQFEACEIAEAAAEEAVYHDTRAKYWQEEQDKAVELLRATAKVEFIERHVTGGKEIDVAVDYGDGDLYAQMRRAYSKARTHREAAERFRSDAEVYGTQGERIYELDLDDVHHFRLHNGEREE